MSNIFRFKCIKKDYTLNRPHLLEEYHNQTVNYILKNYPDQNRKFVSDWVRRKMREQKKDTKLKMISFPQPGHFLKRISSIEEVFTELGNSLISPSGTAYKNKDQIESPISSLIRVNINLRGFWKKIMFKAIMNNDPKTEQKGGNMQTSAKIENNALSGQMGSKSSHISDIYGYNAITSVGRILVKTGYAHTERLFSGSLYLKDLDSCLLYIQKSLDPKYYNERNVQKIFLDYSELFIPSEKDLFDYLMKSFKLYTYISEEEKRSLKNFISKLKKEELFYVFYRGCLYNLVNFNKDFFRKFIEGIFEDIETNNKLNPKEIFDFDEDFINMILPLKLHILDGNPKLTDTYERKPELVQHLFTIMKKADGFIRKKHFNLLTTMFFTNPEIPNLWEHEYIVRNSVGVSDTDSVIFTTTPMFKNVYDNLFSEEIKQAHFFATYLLSQSLEHNLAHITTQLGVAENDRHLVKMKNEFYYSVFIRSSLAKHYIGQQLVKEGNVLSKPELDIKGVSFKGSSLPKKASDFLQKDLIEWFFKEVQEKGEISALEMNLKIAHFENSVYESLKDGSKEYLPTVSVKNKEAYKNPMSSNWLMCDLWNECFADRFIPIDFPNKVWAMPLKEKGMTFLSDEYMNTLSTSDEFDILNKVKRYIEENNIPEPKRFMFPVGLEKIPKMIRPLIDVRKIIYKNGSPCYLYAQHIGTFSSDKELDNLLVLDVLPKSVRGDLPYIK